MQKLSTPPGVELDLFILWPLWGLTLGGLHFHIVA